MNIEPNQRVIFVQPLELEEVFILGEQYRAFEPTQRPHEVLI